MQMHRTCLPQNPLLPLDPEDLLSVIGPEIAFALIPRASVEITGSFKQVLSQLLTKFHIGAADPEKIIIPCLKRQVLAVEKSLEPHTLSLSQVTLQGASPIFLTNGNIAVTAQIPLPPQISPQLHYYNDNKNLDRCRSHGTVALHAAREYTAT